MLSPRDLRYRFNARYSNHVILLVQYLLARINMDFVQWMVANGLSNSSADNCDGVCKGWNTVWLRDAYATTSQIHHSIKLPYVHKFLRPIGLAAVFVLQGCAAQQGSLNPNLDADAKTDVTVQVCLPFKRVYFNDIVLERLENHPLFTEYSPQELALAPKTIRRVANSSDPRAIHEYGIGFGEVLNREGVLSDGGGFMSLQDSTIADQPVYEQGYGYPARNYIAMHVRLPANDTQSQVTYWFELPKYVPSDKFSDWFKSISMEPEDQRLPGWWKLTHGQGLTMYPVPTDSPRMRVTLMPLRAKHKDPTIDTLPALTTARIKFKTPTSDKQFVYEFVPASKGAIPACD
jgi:hypothetical protein